MSERVDPSPPRGRALRELAALFLRLGCTAFGGPAAHIALMEEAVVRRRRWLSRDELLDLVGASHLVPGPTSTELALHIGLTRAGWPGLVVAGACFILPAALITLALALAYQRFGRVPAAEALLAGVKPVMIAVVAEALFNFAASALKRRGLVLAGLGALALAAAGLDELLTLVATGAVAAAGAWWSSRARPSTGSPADPADDSERRRRGRADPAAAPRPEDRGSHPGTSEPRRLPGLALLAGATPAAATAVGAPAVFLVFLKIGSVLFGSGYVLLAFLRAELVERRTWLSEAQLLDAVAIGQLTPGPVFTTATFIGQLVGGLPAAAAATAGIFLPAFVFVLASGPLVAWARRSPVTGAFLDGVNVASLALMALVSWQLARAAVVDWLTASVAVGAALGLRARLPSYWLILAGALAGLLAHLARG